MGGGGGASGIGGGSGGGGGWTISIWSGITILGGLGGSVGTGYSGGSSRSCCSLSDFFHIFISFFFLSFVLLGLPRNSWDAFFG